VINKLLDAKFCTCNMNNKMSSLVGGDWECCNTI